MMDKIVTILVAVGVLLAFTATGYAVPSDEEFIKAKKRIAALEKRVAAMRAGKDRTMKRAIEKVVKEYCSKSNFGVSASVLVEHILKNQALLGNIANALKPHLDSVSTKAQIDPMIESWIKEQAKQGGILRLELKRFVSEVAQREANEVFNDRKDELLSAVPKPTVKSSMQAVLGFSGNYLLREQGYFLLSIGVRAVTEGGDLELVLLAGPGQDFERDDHMDFVFGGRGVIALEMVENFNFRFGATGVMKTATREGNARSGDVAIHGGIEIEFASWFYVTADVGPTWSLREDQGGIGLLAAAGLHARIF